MPWQVKLNEQYPIVEQHLIGHVSEEEVGQSFHELLRLAMESKRWLTLGDLTQYENNLSLDKQFFHASTLTNLSPAMLGKIRSALVIKGDPEVRQSYLMWVSLVKNRGINFDIFTNREEAIRWLLQQD